MPRGTHVVRRSRAAMGADADHTRRPLDGCYLQKGQLPELQTVVAAAALVATTATSADAIVRIVVFMK